MSKVLVTGGTGYIGSHTVVKLIENGYDVVIIDNLINSDIEVLNGIEKTIGKKPHFFKGDISQEQDLQELFSKHKDIESVIHFAALKAVGESVEKPLLYYKNNVQGLICLLEACAKNSVKNFVFSSSCTVYGQPNYLPADENCEIKPESPYGNTKRMNEEILKDFIQSNSNIKAVALRYFNPIGAHPKALIGELPRGVPNNLLPFITQTAIGLRNELKVFGDDYNTPDRTCIRDYIDVNDLAEAHIKALEYLNQNTAEKYDVFNLGTGKGLSVLEIINTFIRTTGQDLNYSIAPRRAGDVEQVWANASKANKILKWTAKTPISDTIKSAWEWEKYYRNKEKS
ncbi:MAG: UDP-glucose 4-epimerase GalE [Bacteroidales bacterium]|nr:UDP-glucose 4-epimerase GalE [Bacteroidales bacterium]